MKRGTEEPGQLATVLAAFIARAKETPGHLALMTGLSKSTIVNWQTGKSKKARDWGALLKLAGALRLDAHDADTLVQAADHPALQELVKQARTAQERELFTRWIGRPAVDGPSDPDVALLLAAQAQFAAMPVDRLPPVRPLPQGSCVPWPHNPRFVDREADLRTIARALSATAVARPGRLPSVAVTGLGGLGKTQLAVEFVQRYGQFFMGGVFWLNFADAANVPSEIASCGTKAAMQLQPEWESLTLDQQLQLVLKAWQSPMPRLLVFDTCEDEALFAQWRPPLGGCRVLLTSRRSKWNPALGISIVAPEVLPRDASITLLSRYRPVAAGEQAALDRIAAEVGDLPLALHLAGTYLERYRVLVTPAAYAGQLGARRLGHPAFEVQTLSTTGPTQSLARTFALSYEQLQGPAAVNTLARRLLAASAFCAPSEAIPRPLLLGMVEELAAGQPAVTLLEDGLQRLLALGLVAAAGDGGVRMHRLIVEFVRLQPAGQAAQAVAEQALVRVLDAANEAGDVVQGHVLHGHLRFMLEQLGERRDVLAAELHRVLGHLLWLRGEYVAAEAELELALAMGRALPDYDPVILAGSLTVLGLTFQLQCRFAPARAAFEQALATWEQLLGADHAFTDAAYNNLGYLVMLQGDYAGAQQHFERALGFLRKTKGLCAVDTSRLLNNLGYLFMRQGRYTHARRYLKLALRIRRKLLPREHVSTATTLNILGEVQYLQADYAAAWASHSEALRMRNALFGDAHHDVGESLGHLGRILHTQGDLAGARQQLEQARAILLGTVGRVHRDTAFALTAYGALLRSTGEYAAAADALRFALDAWAYQGGAAYPEAVPTLNELALVRAAQGDYLGAREVAEQAGRIAAERLGATHPDRGASLFTLGVIQTEQGEREAAQRLFAEALAIFEQRLGLEHPQTRTARAKVEETRA